MRTNRENTADIINENIWNKSDQRSVEDLLFESFGRPIMAKDLQNELRSAAFDKKYGDFNEGDEQNQQENPESNRNFLIFSEPMIEFLLNLCYSTFIKFLRRDE